MGNMKIEGGRFALLVLIAVGIGVAEAQPAAQAEAADEVASPAEQLAVREDPTKTPEQMLTEGRSTVEFMESGATNIRRMLREAREDRDVVKALCLDDKLNQMDVAKRSATERLTGLQSAVEGNNTERMRHEYAVLSAIRERAQALVAEANQCIGEETGFVGESRVTMTVDPNIPDADTAPVPQDPIISQPPVLNSPTF